MLTDGNKSGYYPAKTPEEAMHWLTRALISAPIIITLIAAQVIRGYATTTDTVITAVIGAGLIYWVTRPIIKKPLD